MTDSWTQDPLVREDAELRALLDRLASTASDPVDPASRAATLERVLAAASTRATAPVTPAWRRRAQQVLAMTGAKVVLAAGVAAATTGGLAATGSLPQPAQQLAHDVGQHVGLDLPAPGHISGPGEPAAPHAPGHLGRSADTGAHIHAPGRIGRDAEDPAPVAPIGPGPAPADEDVDAPDRQRPLDAGRPDAPGTPVHPEPPDDPGQVPADPGQAPQDPGQAPQDSGQAPAAPRRAPDTSAGTDADADADAEAPGGSGDAPGQTGDAPPADHAARGGGRP